MKEKYMFLIIQIRCGEYEFECKSINIVPERYEMKMVADAYASTFYGNTSEEDNSWYFFNAGEIAVRVRSYQEITEQDYLTLKKFI